MAISAIGTKSLQAQNVQQTSSSNTQPAPQLPSTYGLVHAWRNVEELTAPCKKWAVALIHKPTGDFLTVAREEMPPGSLTLPETLPETPEKKLKLYADNLLHNMNISQDEKIALIRQNYFPIVIMSEGKRGITFLTIHGLWHETATGYLFYHLISENNRIWGMVSYKENPRDDYICVDPRMVKFQFPDNLTTQEQKFQEIGKSILPAISVEEGFVSRTILHKWPSVPGGDEENRTICTPLLTQTENCFHLGFCYPNAILRDKYDMQKVDLGPYENLSTDEKITILKSYMPNVETLTFKIPEMDSRLDPKVKISWQHWAVTLIDSGRALNSGHLCNSLTPSLVGHASILIEGIENGKYCMYKTHAVEGKNTYKGRLIPLYEQVEEVKITRQIEKIRSKSQTYLRDRKDLIELKEFIKKQRQEVPENLGKFSMIGYVKDDLSHSSSSNNCTDWAMTVFKALQISLPQTPLSDRSFTNNVLSGIRSGAAIDASSSSDSSLTLVSPDAFTVPVKGSSLIGRVANYLGYGFSYAISAFTSLVAQDHNERGTDSALMLTLKALQKK